MTTVTPVVLAIPLVDGPPTAQDVLAYLGEGTSATEDEVTGALAAEKAAQARLCEVPEDDEEWPADLAEALKRRVARNLAARAVPVASFTTFEGGATGTRVPRTDPEIVRLEGPFLLMDVG